MRIPVMSWNDIAVRKKLYAFFLFNSIFFIAVMALITHNLYIVGDDAELLSRPRSDTRLLAAEVSHLQWALNVQNYVMDGGEHELGVVLDGRKCAFGTWFYSGGREQMAQALPSTRAVLSDLEEHHLRLHESAGLIHDDITRGDTAAARVYFESATMPLLARIQEDLGRAVALSRDSESGIIARLNASLRDMIRLALMTSAAFLLAGILAAFMLVRGICNPLGCLTAAARRVANGEFAPVELDRKDEVGQLAAAFNTMTGVVKEKLGVAEGIMRGMTVPFAACDLQGRLTHVNRNMLDCWGRTGHPEDYIGVPSGDFFLAGASKDAVFAHTLHDSAAVIDRALTIVTPTGSRKHLRLDTAPLRNLDGEIVGAFTIHTDLTEIYAQKDHIAELVNNTYRSAGTAREISRTQSEAFENLLIELTATRQKAEEQDRDATAAAGTVRDMNDAMRGMAENVAQSMEKSRNAQIEAEQGTDVVRQTISCIGEVAEQTADVAARMKELDSRATDIGKILELIKDVADQTNLLALNAAIEAARAGEAGKGFAVVADEVRKLAEKTMRATDEVSGAVSAIQSSVQASADATDKAVALTRRATELADSSGTRLNHIQQVIGQAVDDIASITEETTRQSRVSEHVMLMMENFSKQAHLTSMNMENSSGHASELRSLSEELCKIIESLRSERRIEERHDITFPCRLHLSSRGGCQCPARLLDISASGLRVQLEDAACTCRQGEEVRIDSAPTFFNGLLDGKDSQVVWTHGDMLGLHFDEPLSPDTLKSFLTFRKD